VTEGRQVTTTLPDREAANRLGRRLVEERLAACAQVVGPVSSVFWWQGEVESAGEWYCHLKTTASRVEDLMARIRELHPYETPEILAVPVAEGDEAYLRWIADSVADASARHQPR
jgi:periplasmic divalent cation tolerance protein